MTFDSSDGARAQYWRKGVDDGANGGDGGQPMSIQRYLAAFGLLIVAGNETTRNSISGGLLALAPGMLCSIPSTSPIYRTRERSRGRDTLLAQHPDQQRRLVEHPELLPGAVKEIVRWLRGCYVASSPPATSHNGAVPLAGHAPR